MGFGGDVGGYLDERVYAREVAERYATSLESSKSALRRKGLLKRLYAHSMSLLQTIPPFHLFCLARLPRMSVALSGLGGDEVFAGYESPWFCTQQQI